MRNYDAWKTGEIGDPGTQPNSPNYDPTRDELIHERAQELFDEWVADEEKVRDAIEQVPSYDEYDLARFFVAFQAARNNDEMAAAALPLFRLLESQVDAALKADADAAAESEFENYTPPTPDAPEPMDDYE